MLRLASQGGVLHPKTMVRTDAEVPPELPRRLLETFSQYTLRDLIAKHPDTTN
jgi:hypothetical protein